MMISPKALLSTTDKTLTKKAIEETLERKNIPFWEPLLFDGVKIIPQVRTILILKDVADEALSLCEKMFQKDQKKKRQHLKR